VTGLAYPSVVLSRIPLLTRLAGTSFRNGGCRSPRKLSTGSSFGGRSEKMGVPKCLIHGVGGGGGGGGFWEGADGSDNNHFAFTKGNFRKEDSVLLSLIQEIEPLDVSLIQKDVSADTLDAMKRTISGMLGLLPSDQFHVLIEAFWEPLSRLLVSSMMTGYTLQNAEYRLCLQKSLYMSEDSSWARQKEETSDINNPEALDDGDHKDSELAKGNQMTSKMEVASEEDAGLQELDIPEGLGELSSEAQDYIRDMQSQLSRYSNELQESRLKNAALQMQNLAGEEKNDLLDYLRSLEPEKVAELSEPTSSEVQEVIQRVIHGLLATLSPKMHSKAPPQFENGSASVRRSWDEDSAEIIENASLQFQPLVSVTRDYLARLLFWCMLLGHYMRGLEYRLELTRMLSLSGDIVLGVPEQKPSQTTDTV